MRIKLWNSSGNELLTFIHPFDIENVIAGREPMALIALDRFRIWMRWLFHWRRRRVDLGHCLCYQIFKSENIKVYGVQAGGARSMLHPSSMKRIGIRMMVSTIADQRRGKGTEQALPLRSAGSNSQMKIATVWNDEISTAILTHWTAEKLITEGAGAVSVAAALFNKFPIRAGEILFVVKAAIMMSRSHGLSNAVSWNRAVPVH